MLSVIFLVRMSSPIKSLFLYLLFSFFSIKISLSRNECVDKRPDYCKKAIKNQYNRFLARCQKDGSKIKTHFCCKSCEELIPKPEISQMIFYLRSNESSKNHGVIYNYVIDEVHGPKFSGKFKVPYTATLPGLTFNYDLKLFLIS